jgi:hypothetical protein
MRYARAPTNTHDRQLTFDCVYCSIWCAFSWRKALKSTGLTALATAFRYCTTLLDEGTRTWYVALVRSHGV